MKILRSAILIFIGVFAMVFGEFDDSPGLQGLGLILIIWILVSNFRNRKLK
jgi:hypothetical protein